MLKDAGLILADLNKHKPLMYGCFVILLLGGRAWHPERPVFRSHPLVARALMAGKNTSERRICQ